MPIIVDEVVISVEAGNQATAGNSGTGLTAADRQSMVQECVEIVLEILKQKGER